MLTAYQKQLTNKVMDKNEKPKAAKRPYVEKSEYPQTAQKEVYTPLQLANYLQLSERYVRDVLNSGKLKGYQKSRRWYILHTDVLVWIKDGNE
jgi:excisionase family DNA binding protein